MYIECFFFFMLFQNSRLLFFCVVFVFFKKWFVFCIGFRFLFYFFYSLEVGLRHFTILYGTFISFIVMVLGITWPVAEKFWSSTTHDLATGCQQRLEGPFLMSSVQLHLVDSPALDSHSCETCRERPTLHWITVTRVQGWPLSVLQEKQWC